MRSSFAFALLAAAHAPAHADFRVCNRTRVLINLAVGTNAGDDFATEGWWTVTPGSCATPVHGPLRGRYVYLYATGIDGADVLKGTVSMCIDRGKFKVYGIENCWRRGLRRSPSRKSTRWIRPTGRRFSPTSANDDHLPFFRAAMASSGSTS